MHLRLSVPCRKLTARLALLGMLAAALSCSACSRDPKVVKAKYVESGERYLAEGKLAEATLEYRNALQADPSDGDLRLKLADVYVQSGQGRKAAEEFIRAADLLVDRVDVQVRAGSILLVTGRFDDAKVRAEKALALDPRSVDSQILLANALAGLKDLKAAVAELEEAIKLAPDRSASYTNLGVIEVTRGKREAAELAFKKAIELDGRSAVAHLALGNFYWATGRQSAAVGELAKSLELEPDNVLVLRSMASFAVASNRFDEAETHLKKLVEVTKTRDATIALADFYIARSNEAAARNVLQPLSTASDGASAANIRLAALDHAAGRKSEAYQKLDAVIASDQTNLQALLVKTSMLLSDGRRDEALAPVQLAIKSHPESATAFFVLGRVQTARNQTDAAVAAFSETLRLNPRASGAQIALSRLHLVAGKAKESVSFAQEAVSANPGNPEARLALVRALVAKGDLKQADVELGTLSAEYPNVAAVRVQKGMVLVLKRDPRARAEFEAAIKSDPNSTEALGGLVALDLAAKQPAAALSRIKDRAEAPTASTGLLMLAARTYAATGDTQTAERFLRRIIEKDPSYLQAYSALGQLYLAQRRLDAALTEFEAMATRDPKPVAALTLAGIILQAQGKQSEAKAKFERVMQIDSSSPVAANNLAWITAESGGNLDVALQLAQTAQRGLPNAAEVADTLGFIYYKKDLFPQAIRAFRTTVEKEPARADYHYRLGLALAKSGDTAGARGHLTQALRLEPAFQQATEARSLLQTLEAQPK